MLNQKELIKKVKDYNRFLNPETLSKAYTFAVEANKLLEVSMEGSVG